MAYPMKTVFAIRHVHLAILAVAGKRVFLCK